jgi:hypothetical protein
MESKKESLSTDRVIRMKKFNFFIFYFFFIASSVEAMPFIFRVGIIPPMVELLKNDPIEKFTDKLNTRFSMEIENSKRFFKIHDSLIQESYKNKEEFKKTVEKLDIHAFFRLKFFSHQDHITIIASCYSASDEKIYLEEQITNDRNFFLTSSVEEKNNLIQKLVFYLLNRFPIDAYVTSQTGDFVTLSAGYNQGLFIGKEIQILRASVSHWSQSYTGWGEFEILPVANGQILSVSPTGSVASLNNSLLKPIMLKSDGIYIESTPSRQYFQNKKK